MQTKCSNFFPLSVGLKQGAKINVEAISRNIAKLKDATHCTKSRNPVTQSNTITFNSTLHERVRSTSRRHPKDTMHEKMLQKELNIFRKEAEVRYKSSPVNAAYKFPKYTNDPGEVGLPREDLESLQRNPFAVIKCTTSGFPEPLEEKPSTLKTMKSMKSIYLTQRGTVNNDIFLYGSLKKMVNQHIKVLSGRASPAVITKDKNGGNAVKILGPKNSNDSTDSRYSYKETRIRNTPYLKTSNIKNAILQKILATMPSSRKAESKDNSNLQGSSINNNALTTSISAMKSFSTERNQSMRAGATKARILCNPLLITKFAKNKK